MPAAERSRFWRTTRRLNGPGVSVMVFLMTQLVPWMKANLSVRLFELAGRAFDILLPHRCLSCGVVVSGGGLCSNCWEELVFLAPPWCAACGLPFPYDFSKGALCGACTARRPTYGRARAMLAYNDASRPLLLGFKHADRTEAAPTFGRWLATAGRELVGEAELIVPAPLHWSRLFFRRYNQAALLCAALSRETGLPLAQNALVRLRRTPPQGNMSPNQRRENVRGAFAVRPPARCLIAGRKILLVDDVMTTGATVEACAKALYKAEALRVDVLTLARTARSVL